MPHFFQNLPSLTDCIYTSHYCEENVWQLCKKITDLKLEGECYAVFISNSGKRIVLWKQKLATPGRDYVIWDYHVVALYGNHEKGYCVFDFDSTLPFPVAFERYVNEAIRSDKTLAKTFHRLFRVVTADNFIKHFSSDRRHMRIGDSWLQPPPSYQPIIADQKNPHNLNNFINMDQSNEWSKVLTSENFAEKFRSVRG